MAFSNEGERESYEVDKPGIVRYVRYSSQAFCNLTPVKVHRVRTRLPQTPVRLTPVRYHSVYSLVSLCRDGIIGSEEQVCDSLTTICQPSRLSKRIIIQGLPPQVRTTVSLPRNATKQAKC